MGRRITLDVLKGVAIALVVFNHALLWPMRAGDRPSAFAYGVAFGTVAAFAAVAGYVQGFHPPREERTIVRKRAGQLLVPWAIWAPVYALAPLVWRWLGGGELPIGTDPGPWAREVLLGGGPLWFLPVLFAATAICAFLDQRTTSWWPAFVALGMYAALAGLAFASNTSPLDLGNGTFWAVAPLYVAAFWFGLRVSRDGLPAIPRGILVALIVVSMLAGGALTLARADSPDLRWLMWMPYAIGVLGGCAALLLAAGLDEPSAESSGLVASRRPNSLLVRLARAGRASLGLYILHPVMVAPVALVARGRGGVWLAALVALGVVALGAPVVEWLRGVPGLRRAV